MLALGRLDALLLPVRQARALLADPLLAELEAGFDQLHRHGFWQRPLARYAPA